MGTDPHLGASITFGNTVIYDAQRLLSDYPVLFKTNLIFTDFSRNPSKFKYFP